MKNLRCISFAYIMISISVFAQDGTPDTAFGDGGVVLTGFGESTIDISAVSQGESGRIAVLGTEYPVLVDTIHFIQVYNEDGAVDTSFGNNGILKIVDNAGAPVYKINVLGDNSIMFSYGGIARKLLPNGEVDTAFGSNGFISIGLSSTDSLGYVLHSDGNIYMFGKELTGDKDFIIAKFDTNGSLDSSFGNQGYIFLNIDSYDLFSSNSIYFLDATSFLFNYSESVNNTVINYITKLDTSGTIDSSFGNQGYIESTYNNLRNSNFHRLNSGVFFISYAAEANGTFFRRVESYLSNGTLNSSFADNGILSGHTVAFVQQNQRLITRQDTPNVNNDYLPALSRVFTNGSSDSSFNFQFNYTAIATPSVSQAADGKIIIAGANNDFPDTNLVVLRYNNTPLGIEENTSNTFAVFPNPTKDVVTISCNTCSLTNKPYQIIDATGRLIQQGSFSVEKPTISMEGLSTGLYYLRIENTAIKLLNY